MKMNLCYRKTIKNGNKINFHTVKNENQKPVVLPVWKLWDQFIVNNGISGPTVVPLIKMPKTI